MGPLLATVSIALLTLFVTAHQTPYSSPDPECPPYYNGSIAGNSCSREYILCVNGIRQAATCPQGSVFFEVGCIPAEESPECQLDDVPTLPEDSEDDDAQEFDCSPYPDGLVSIGCLNQFVNCVAGQPYVMYCPGDLLFNGATQDCREECDEDAEDVTTTRSYQNEDVEASGEDEYAQEPVTQPPEPIDFDCGGLEDGNHADGCSDVFYTCVHGQPVRKYCPQGTVFNPTQQACDYDCSAYVPSTTTTASPVYTTTTTVQDDVTSSTSDYEATTTTTPGFDDIVTTTTTSYEAPPTTTPASDDVIVCPEGQVTTFGMCSSRFNRCQDNSIRSKQCPVNTLFESALVLCVFDLPQCQPITHPGNPIFYGSSRVDTIVSPFDENVRLRPKFEGRRRGPGYRRSGYGGYGGRTVIENPFFIPRHRSDRRRDRNDRERGYYGPAIDSPFSTNIHPRASLADEFKDYRRTDQGKINYGPARPVEGNKRFLMDDGFDGKTAKYLQSDVDRIFPLDRDSEKKFGPRRVDFDDGEATFEAKDLFGATRRKRSVYGSSGSSGYVQITARQAQVNQDCQQYTTPTFLTFGDCYDQFIYCSGSGVNRMAACPIGETFSKALRSCSETCGAPVTTSDDSGVTTSSVYGSDDSWTTSTPGNDDSWTTTSSTPSEDVPSTTTRPAPIGDRCASVPSGLYSLGCSRKYIQCSNGAAIVRLCSAGLFFNQDSQSCNFRDEIRECGAQQDPTTTTTVSPYGPVVVTDSYGTPSEDDTATTTTSAPVGDRCTYVSSGLFSIGCSSKYIQCSNGVAIKRSCAASLIFNEKTQECTFRDNVAECQESTTPSADPSTTPSVYGESQYTTQGYGSSDSTTTTPGSDATTTAGYRTPSDDQPTTYAPTLAPYRPVVPDQTPQDEPQNACSGLADGSHGIGCSSSYIVCFYGHLVSSITCPLGEGFDPTTEACRTFSEIPQEACDQPETTTDAGLSQPLPYVTLDDILSTTTTTEAPITSTTSSDAPVTVPYGSDDSDDSEDEESSEDDEKCTVGERASSGFCVQTFLECTATGFVQKTCRVGKLFDAHSNRCVPRIACGKEALRDAVKDVFAATSTSAPKRTDGRCAHIDGEAILALGACTSHYVKCSYGVGKLQHCAGGHVFSNAHLECVSRETAPGCEMQKKTSPVKSYYNNQQDHASGGYCDGKSDGLYGNKRDCSAVLQCFGGELFEHPSCPSNLAFNELTGKCDYPQKVSGCENFGRTDGVCSEHGQFIADVSDCSVFYRCVWGRKVVMRCPSGTVFNPLLSVCDWPSAVPSCSGSSGSSSGSYY